MSVSERKDFAPEVHFTEQTPKQQIGEAEQSELYKKAWFENDADMSSEFSQNTTAWD